MEERTHAEAGKTVPIDHIVIPFQKFLHSQATAGALLIATAVIALVWANSSIGHTYDEFWHTKLTFGFGKYKIAHDLHWWINEALMALFFLLVGLEILVRVRLMDGAFRWPRILPLRLVYWRY